MTSREILGVPSLVVYDHESFAMTSVTCSNLGTRAIYFPPIGCATLRTQFGQNTGGTQHGFRVAWPCHEGCAVAASDFSPARRSLRRIGLRAQRPGRRRRDEPVLCSSVRVHLVS